MINQATEHTWTRERGSVRYSTAGLTFKIEFYEETGVHSAYMTPNRDSGVWFEMKNVDIESMYRDIIVMGLREQWRIWLSGEHNRGGILVDNGWDFLWS
jgi:hypothetical protein